MFLYVAAPKSCRVAKYQASFRSAFLTLKLYRRLEVWSSRTMSELTRVLDMVGNQALVIIAGHRMILMWRSELHAFMVLVQVQVDCTAQRWNWTTSNSRKAYALKSVTKALQRSQPQAADLRIEPAHCSAAVGSCGHVWTPAAVCRNKSSLHFILRPNCASIQCMQSRLSSRDRFTYMQSCRCALACQEKVMAWPAVLGYSSQ